METATLYKNDLEFDHARWENELDFYKNEIEISEAHLGDLLHRSLSKEDMVTLEQFQNRFIRQKEVVDELKHRIHVYEDDLAAIDHNDALPQPDLYLPKHMDIAKRIKHFHQLFIELRGDFEQFLSRLLH